MRKAWVGLTAILVLASLAGAQQKPGTAGWTQLSLSTSGVDKFLAAHPQSDGRGVVIAVLDTGVDPGIPGLTTLPDGGVKVVDVQDFTGDGDVELSWIGLNEDGKLVRDDGEGEAIAYEPPKLPEAACDEQRRWWFGTFNEKKFVNADQADLNGNEQTEDEFPVLVTALEGDSDDLAVCFVDTNLDRSFADEKPLRNYKLHYDTLLFQRERPEREIPPLTFAVNIFLRQAKVVFHFDNGAHGTHVAGIAAGYRINDQDGFNGVAPGAQVISLKIGCGWLGGVSVTESKKKALAYAARYAREHNVQVVCNLSFGVESEIEGESDIDELVDEVLRANPYLVFCTSAGNSGPGLSTVGTPAAATDAICVGALMAADTGRDVSGWSLSGPVVTLFSSRGGELDKPDVVAPGWSTSTVPRFVREGDFWSGTSMASPYAAGLAACLISHAKHSQPDVKVRACDVRRALCLSAQPVVAATPLDMGYGLPDLTRAAELLPKLLALAKDDPVISYEISTPCPYGLKGKARAAYWRSTWFPAEDRQTFTIEPVFAPLADASVRASFTRKFELRSKTPWCRVPQGTVYLHAEQSARVFVEYDAAQLKQPGLHVGVVEAVADGLVAFRLLNTIVVPHRFTAAEDYRRSFKDQVAKGWELTRYFIAVPAGASALRVVLAAPDGQASRAAFDGIYDPVGRQHGGFSILDTDNGRREIELTISDKLTPGVWEIPVVANRPDKEWPYDLTVQFYGLAADPPVITEGSAAKPSGELVVTNLFEQPIAATGDGQIEGFRFHKEDKFKGLKDTLTYPLTIDERCNRLRLHLEMSREDYATTTDIAVIVQAGDEDEALYKSGFEGRVHEATLNTSGKKSLKLKITAGFAVADDKRETPITVQVDQLLSSAVGVKVTQDDEANFTFVPGVPVELSFEADKKLTEIPGGQRPVGYLRFRERSSDELVLRVPMDIGG